MVTPGAKSDTFRYGIRIPRVESRAPKRGVTYVEKARLAIFTITLGDPRGRESISGCSEWSNSKTWENLERTRRHRRASSRAGWARAGRQWGKGMAAMGRGVRCLEAFARQRHPSHPLARTHLPPARGQVEVGVEEVMAAVGVAVGLAVGPTPCRAVSPAVIAQCPALLGA